jgi:hypothetical protein
MKSLLFTCLLMIGTLSVGILNAGSPSEPQHNQRPGTQVSFSGLKLTGRLKKPDLSYIYRRRGVRAEQIVNIPEDFNEEIAQGAGKF